MIHCVNIQTGAVRSRTAPLTALFSPPRLKIAAACLLIAYVQADAFSVRLTSCLMDDFYCHASQQKFSARIDKYRRTAGHSNWFRQKKVDKKDGL